MWEQFKRTEMLLGQAGMQALAAARVAVLAWAAWAVMWLKH